MSHRQPRAVMQGLPWQLILNSETLFEKRLKIHRLLPKMKPKIWIVCHNDMQLGLFRRSTSTQSVSLWWWAGYLDLGCFAAYCCRDITRNWPWRNTADRSSIMLLWSHVILIHDLLRMNATYRDADNTVCNDTDQTGLTQRSDISMA